jgi:hypothetical protein
MGAARRAQARGSDVSEGPQVMIRVYWDGELDPFAEFEVAAGTVIPTVGQTLEIRETVQTAERLPKEIVQPAVVLAVQPELMLRRSGHLFGLDTSEPVWHYQLRVTLANPEREKRYG